jgi:hypothetical protein
VIRAPQLDRTDRFAEVLEVDHDAGPDAFVDREAPSYEPEYEWTPRAGVNPAIR